MLSAVLAVAMPILVPVSARAAEPGSFDRPCDDSSQPYVCVTVSGEAGAHVVARPDLDCDLRPDPCDIRDAQYPVRSADDDTERRPVSGASIEKVIAAATPARTFTFATVSTPQRTRQYRTVLDGRELAGSAAFTAGLRPVFYYRPTTSGSDAVGFVRPQRNSDDVNDLDVFDDVNFVHLDVHTRGRALFPTVAASIENGTASLSVSVANPTATGLQFAWSAPAGRSSDGGSTYRYEYRGSACNQYVSVTVTGDDTSYGESPPVKVGSGTRDCPTSGATPRAAPRTTSAPRGADPTGTAATGTDARGTGSAGNADGSGGAASGAGRGSDGPDGRTGAGSTPAPSLPVAPSGDAGALVSGRLLDASGAGAAGKVSSDGNAVAMTPARARSAGGSSVVWLWAAAPLALLAAGFVVERRRT